VNMRPQHITDSFLIKPIAESDRPNAFREEVRQVERTRARARRNRLVERSYYVVYVLERDDKGSTQTAPKVLVRSEPNGLPPGASSRPSRTASAGSPATLPIRTGLQHPIAVRPGPGT